MMLNTKTVFVQEKQRLLFASLEPMIYAEALNELDGSYDIPSGMARQCTH